MLPPIHRQAVKRIIAIFLMCSARLLADGALYVHDHEKPATQSLIDGCLVVRQPLQRVTITHAVLRYDTDDKKIIWLELHMKESRDSGEFLLL